MGNPMMISKHQDVRSSVSLTAGTREIVQVFKIICFSRGVVNGNIPFRKGLRWDTFEYYPLWMSFLNIFFEYLLWILNIDWISEYALNWIPISSYFRKIFEVWSYALNMRLISRSTLPKMNHFWISTHSISSLNIVYISEYALHIWVCSSLNIQRKAFSET